MDFSKVFGILNQANVNREDVFKLVDLIKQTDLNDERNIRDVIKKASIIAKKDINKELEDKMVDKIMKEGLTPSLIDLL